MAIIIKCAGCKARRKTDQGLCPACGAAAVRYLIDYRPQGRNGIRCQRYLDPNIRSLAIAREIDRETKLAIRERRNPEQVQDMPQYSASVDELLPEYMNHFRLHHRTNVNPDRLEKSFREREQSLAIFSRIIGPTPVLLLDKHVIANYQRVRSQHVTRTGTAITNRTINKEVCYALAFITWCRKSKDLAVSRPEISMLPYKRPRPIILSPDEVVRLVDAAEPFYRAFFLCLYTLGLRLSEARYLRWRDVDRENKIVRVIQKGGSEKAEPLNKWLDQALKKLPAGGPDDYIFRIERTGRPILDARRALERAAKKAGIIKRITPHLLRHSIATHMLAKNVNLRTIQVMLGHADSTTTEWYTHAVTDNIREATEGMFAEMSRKRVKK